MQPFENYKEEVVPEWRRDIQPGDLLLSRSVNPVFPLGAIDFWTHVGIYVGNGKVVEAISNGVVETDITSWDYPNKTCVELLRVHGANDTVVEGVITFVKNQIGMPYWLSAGYKSIDPLDPLSPGWYCSELAWAAYFNQRIDIEYTPDPWVVSPQEINDDEDTYEINNHMEEIPTFRGLLFGLFSPADLIVTDPDGLSISKELNEIPGAVYITDDFDGDGDPDYIVILPDIKIGDYLVSIVPAPDAEPTDTYSLEVVTEQGTIVLAEDVQIDDIPRGGYIIKSGETGVTAWNYFFKDSVHSTKLYVNSTDHTFQFVTADKEFLVKTASRMKIIDLTNGKVAKYNWYSRNWWIDTSKLDLDKELIAYVNQSRFRERPEKLIMIRYQDEELWLAAAAVDENIDFCVVRARDFETGKYYLLVDKPGVETILTTEMPIANFVANKTNGRAPLFVLFTDISEGEITNWLWDFGDGGTSTRQSPSHIYWRPGNYTVTLTVSGPRGSDTIVMNYYIKVELLWRWR
jgi:PKD repeat protein/cell wall-associated NlpC family hydrolase